MKRVKITALQQKETTMIEMKRAALYARFSSDNQRTESIDAQVRVMKQYCRENKWKIVEIYIDEAHSATTDRRPNFQRMIEDSSKKLFDIRAESKDYQHKRNSHRKKPDSEIIRVENGCPAIISKETFLFYRLRNGES